MRIPALATVAVAGLFVPIVMSSSAQAAPGDLQVTAVHAITGVETVDVFVGAGVPPAFDNIGFGDVPVIEVAPGTVTDVIVTAPDADTTPPILPLLGDPALGITGYTVSSDASLVAQVDATGAPLLKAYVDDLSPTPAGQSRIIVRHAAQAPAVSVHANGAQVIPAISNGEEKILTVPAGSYSVDVKLNGAVVPGLTTAGIPLPLSAGSVYIVYAAGTPQSGYDFVLDVADVGEASAATTTSSSTSTTATTSSSTAASATTSKPVTTSTRPAIPTAVPAGDGSSGWAGPLGVPALLAIVLAVGLALAVVLGMRGDAPRRR